MDKGKRKKSVRSGRDLELESMLKDVNALVTTEVRKYDPVLAQWFSTQFGRFIKDVSETGGDAERHLPPELGALLVHKKAWLRACEKGYIWYDGERWRFKVKKVRLAYICGRCFSDDCRRKGKWKKGEWSFPGAMLERVFGVENLVATRGNMLGKQVPGWAKEVDDELF